MTLRALRAIRSLGCAGAVLLGAVLSAQVVQINGAGATLPFPLYSKWIDEYAKVRPDTRINYQSVGSGAGIRLLVAQTVFFGATDTPMTPEEARQAPGSILHVPTVLGAVVPVYNLPTVRTPLRFSGAVLADIYLGRIVRWNDAAIAALNPDVALPALDIIVVHRSEGSGTTYIWVDFLSKVSAEFMRRVGVNAAVNWPVGVGGKGNEGVAGLLKQLPGSLGYVELIYAVQSRIAYGAVQNAAGEFVTATVASVTAAATAAASRTAPDLWLSITNAPGRGVYPISSFSWMLLYENPRDKPQARAMVQFLRWALTDGQRYCEALGYARLPPDLVRLELAALTKIKIS